MTDVVSWTRNNAIVPPLDREGFREGLRDIRIPGIGIAIWGLVTGVAMVNKGLSVSHAIVLSLIAYAGSAQLAVLPLLVLGAPIPTVLITATLVNVRFIIFSAATRNYFAGVTALQRLVAGGLLGDVGQALFLNRHGGDEIKSTPRQHGYYFGINFTNYVVWHVSSIAGIVAGNVAPTKWGLELAATLALLAVLIPMMIRVPTICGVVATGIVSVLLAKLPNKLGLPISVVIGVSVAMVVETWRSRFGDAN